jgi:hypothetical protein
VRRSRSPRGGLAGGRVGATRSMQPSHRPPPTDFEANPSYGDEATRPTTPNDRLTGSRPSHMLCRAGP